MGRPIKKSRFVSDFGAATAGKIAVSNYRTGGSNTASTTAYIVSQRGSRQFKIHMDDSSEGVFTLVTDATLSVNNTFNVKVVLDDSTVAFVNKFYNNTVHFTKTDGSHGHVPYTLGTDIQGSVESGHGNIDIVSE
tara:strand:- start:1651 stop:2055 length:405 start_codon:yes stop_codon:yes gene_type:complete